MLIVPRRGHSSLAWSAWWWILPCLWWTRRWSWERWFDTFPTAPNVGLPGGYLPGTNRISTKWSQPNFKACVQTRDELTKSEPRGRRRELGTIPPGTAIWRRYQGVRITIQNFIFLRRETNVAKKSIGGNVAFHELVQLLGNRRLSPDNVVYGTPDGNNSVRINGHHVLHAAKSRRCCNSRTTL